MGENKPKEKLGPKLVASNKSITPVITSTSSSNAEFTSSSSSSSVVQTSAVLRHVMRGDINKLARCFDDPTDPDHETIAAQISLRSAEDGRAPLDWAAILGRDSIVAELLQRGVDANSVTEKGYTAAHFAAAWGQVGCLRILFNRGANLQMKNVYSETPRDVAKRYEKLACVDYLDWTDAKMAFKSSVLVLKEQLVADKQKGLSKEEKTSLGAVIGDQLQWLDKVTDDTSTIDEINEQRENFKLLTQPITSKLMISSDNASAGEKLDKTKAKNQDKKA